MKYKTILSIFFILILTNCDQYVSENLKKNNFDPIERYTNSGFALIYNDNLKNIKKLESRSLDIYHKSLKKKSSVKITNPRNGKYLIAEVKSNNVKFSNFYNSVLSLRIAEDLELNFNEPYVEITMIQKNSTFVAKKAKMFEEEKSVAEKAPVDGIQINDLNQISIDNQEIKSKNFSYSIKVADFYYENTALLMLDKIKTEANIKKLKIIKLSKTKFRVLIGPFNDIKSLKRSFEKLDFLNFENLEILDNV